MIVRSDQAGFVGLDGPAGAPHSAEGAPRSGGKRWRWLAALLVLALALCGLQVAAVVGGQIIWRHDVTARLDALQQNAADPSAAISRTAVREDLIRETRQAVLLRQYGIAETGDAGMAALRELIVGDVAPSPAAVAALMAETPRPQWKQPEQISVQVCLLPTLSEAERVAAQIGEAPTESEFSAAVATYSQHAPTVAYGGEIGLAGWGYYPRTVEQVLFALPEGAVSPPLEWEGGYALFRIREHRPGILMTEAEIEAQITQMLTLTMQDEQFDSFLRDALAQIRIIRLLP